MKLSLTHALVLATALSVGAFFYGRTKAGSTEPATADHLEVHPGHVETAQQVWTCSMDPQVRLPEPGACPICGMDLILGSSDSSSGSSNVAVLSMSTAAMARAEIQTAKVERRDLNRRVPLVGRVALDETRVSTITSWVEGRLDRLFVDFTGTRVRAGDHVAEIYSPTLYSAQEELLQAVAAANRVAKSDLTVLRESTQRTLSSSKERLRLFGLSVEQIDALILSGEAQEQITLFAQMDGVVIHKVALEGMFVKPGSELVKLADLSRVWVLLDAFESDLAWLRFGQTVNFSVEAYPGESFEARIAFIDPIVNPATHTVQVRLSVDNSLGRLKPDMFVSAIVQAGLSGAGHVLAPDLGGDFMCPMHPEVVSDETASCSICGMDLVASSELGFVSGGSLERPLAIPDTAPMFTGQRSVVYVRLADHEKPTFEGREVLLGAHAGDWYVVLDGLQEGDDVVVHGNFKIDAELQIRARPSMMRGTTHVGAMDMGRPITEPAHHISKAAPAISKETEVSLKPVVPDPSFEDFQKGLGRFVEDYLALQIRLTEDGFETSFGDALVRSLAEIETGALGPKQLGVWNAAVQTLRPATQSLAQAADIDVARIALEGLSEALVRVIERFGLPDGQAADLAIYNCPMAFDYKGANWLGARGGVVNPYFGSSMLHCGTTVRELGKGNQE